jgi:hypothetical protein
MSKVARGNPASQQFNVSPRPCQSKDARNCWWGHTPFHNNAVKKVK